MVDAPTSYQLGRAVGYGDESAFLACFTLFKAHLAAGHLDWSLLEGPPAPDALLAHHLLRLLPLGEVTAMRDSLAAQAEVEARVIAAAIPNAKAPLLTDPADVRDFLVKHA